ncbi:hypothetical protein BDD12DRAFT_834329 [Trichophaea hybrida]|nr:hypothetical protein BDD12DRAFT_834329 [Trichophaea hybrida]
MLPGKPYYGQRASGELATIDDGEEVFSAVTDILIELKNHPFSRMGSLLYTGSQIEVSALASDGFMIVDPIGPFDSNVEYFNALINYTSNIKSMPF